MIRRSKNLFKFNTAFIALLVGLVSFSFGSVYAQEAATSSLRLIGTIEARNFSGGVFQDKAGKQSFYRLHEKLSDGSEIVRVHDDSISLMGPDGTMYDMYISHEMTRVASAAPAVTPPANTARLRAAAQKELFVRPNFREIKKRQRLRREEFED